LVELRVGTQFIQTTPEHPFFLNGKWVKAAELQAGDSLSLFGGQKLALRSINIRDTACTVYNFAVETAHTYFVSKLKVLVHNACGQPEGGTTNAASSLPKLKGKSIPKIEKTLDKKDFQKVNDNGINQKWKHSDGSEVRVHKYGNQNTTSHRSANNAHIHKQDPSGSQLNDRGNRSLNPNQTHIGVKNPRNLPQIRNRNHGS
jgi:hypothetical protein